MTIAVCKKRGKRWYRDIVLCCRQLSLTAVKPVLQTPWCLCSGLCCGHLHACVADTIHACVTDTSTPVLQTPFMPVSHTFHAGFADTFHACVADTFHACVADTLMPVLHTFHACVADTLMPVDVLTMLLVVVAATLPTTAMYTGIHLWPTSTGQLHAPRSVQIVALSLSYLRRTALPVLTRACGLLHSSFTSVDMNLWPSFPTAMRFGFYVALRPRRRDDLLGTGTEWEGGGWLARPRKPPEKDRRDRRPPPEQWKC